MAEPFDFFVPSEAPAQLDFDPANQVVSTANPVIAEQRAIKANIGLGEQSPGVAPLYSQFVTGQDQTLRESVAFQKTMALENRKAEVIQELASKGALTKETKALIFGLSYNQPEDPNTILEKLYAQEAVQSVFSTLPIAKAITGDGPASFENPQMVFKLRQHAGEVQDYFTEQLFIKEGLQKKLEEMEARWKQLPYVSSYENGAYGPSKVGAELERFMGPLFNARMSSGETLKGLLNYSKDWKELHKGVGDDIRDQVNQNLNREPGEAIKTVNEKAEAIWKKNPAAAIEYLRAHLALTTDDVKLKNFFGVLDAAMPLGGLVGLKNSVRASEAALAAVGNLGKTMGTVTALLGRRSLPKMSEVVEATGEIQAASRLKFQEQIKDAANATPRNPELKEVFGKTVGIQDPESVIRGSTTLTAPTVNELRMQVQRGNKIVADVLEGTDRAVIERLPEGSLARQAAEEGALNNYTRLNDYLLNVSPANLNRGPNVLTREVTLGEKGIESRVAEVQGIRDARNPTPFTETTLTAANEQSNKLASLKREYDDLLQRKLNAPVGSKQKESLGKQLENNLARQAKAEKATTTKAELGAREAGPGGKPFERLAHNPVDRVTLTFGNAERDIFASSERAHYAAKNLMGLRDYEVTPMGKGYVVQTHIPVPETTIDARAALRQEVNTPNKPGPTDTFPEWLRHQLEVMRGRVGLKGMESAVNKELRESFHQMLHGTKVTENQLRTIAEPIAALQNGKKEPWNQWKDFLEDQKRWEDPLTGAQGKFSPSQGAFEQEWFTKYKTTPTEAQSKAYWAYVQSSDIDYALRVNNLYKGKVRDGLEMWALPRRSYQDEYGPLNHPGIEGKRLTSIPDAPPGQFTNVLLWKEEGALKPKLWEPGTKDTHYTQEERAQIKQDLASGRLIAIELKPTGNVQLRQLPGLDNVSEHQIHIVLTDKAENSPLRLADQLPYKAGGHRDYATPYKVSQPIIARGPEGAHVYYGDKTLHGQYNLKEAEALQEKYRTAQALLKDAGKERFIADGILSDKHAALEKYLANNLPHTLEKFMGMYKGYGKGGYLDINVPVFAHSSGTNLADTSFKSDKKSLAEQLGLSNGYIKSTDWHVGQYSSTQLRYTQERGDALTSVQLSGDKNKPLWESQPARMVDPALTMQRASTDLARNQFLDDLKIKAAEQFAQEFGHVIQATPAELARDPYKHLAAPVWREGANASDVQAAKDLRRSTMGFLNIQDEGTKTWEYFRQQMIEYWAPTAQGQKTVEAWGLSSIKRPDEYLRAAASHLILGTLNWPQAIVQATGAASAWAIAGPKIGTAALRLANRAVLLSRTESPEIIAQVARDAVAAGLVRKPEHFIDYITSMRAAGFDKVGNEFVGKNFGATPLLPGALSKVASKDFTFFNAGEGYSRKVGYAAAFLERLEANPSKAISNQDRQGILGRAYTMTGKQGAGSTFPLQEVPVVSLMSQMLNSQFRLTGLYLGKDLSPIEKARLFLMQSIIAGPIVAAGGASGIPLKWLVSKSQEKQGIDPNATIASEVFNTGLLNTIAHHATGREIDFGGRFSQGGISLFQDLLSSDKKWYHLLTGAAGTKGRSALEMADPFFMSMYSIFNPSQEYYISKADYLDWARTITSVDNAVLAWDMFTTGQLKTKGEKFQVPVTAIQAALITATGARPSAMERDRTLKDVTADEKSSQKPWVEKAVRDIARASQAANDGDWEGYRKFRDHATLNMRAANMRPDEMDKVFSEAANRLYPQIQRGLARFDKDHPTQAQRDIFNKRMNEINNNGKPQ